MKIRMTTLAAGPFGVLRPGQIYDVEDGIGQALVAGGYAAAVEEPEQIREDVPVEPDNLSAIKGIGKRTQSALAALGITTYQALADADPDELAAALDGSSAEQVSGWQAQVIGFLG